MSISTRKSYSECMMLPTFEERYEYLKLNGRVGEETFGPERYLNQILYRSPEWRKVRRDVILRDLGCDLADPGYEIFDKILIHHINPITIEDIENRDPSIFDMENLITVSHRTHNAIHYGDASLLSTLPPERYPGDMCPWL